MLPDVPAKSMFCCTLIIYQLQPLTNIGVRSDPEGVGATTGLLPTQNIAQGSATPPCFALTSRKNLCTSNQKRLVSGYFHDYNK